MRSEHALHELGHAFSDLFFGVLAALVVGIATALVLRRYHLKWTWAMLGFLLSFAIELKPFVFLCALSASLLACLLGAVWHRSDLDHGADFAEAARARVGVFAVLARSARKAQIKRQGWIIGGWLALGSDRSGMPVSIPVGYQSGSHTLVLGATGSGKTVSEAWIACRLIEAGHSAIVIDPKGDQMLCQALQLSAIRADRRFMQWTPEGPRAYNPYANGGDTEIADKALSGEVFTEPHYLRQAQRFLGHAVRTMHAAGVAVTPVSLMAHLDPDQLEVTARALPEPDAERVQAYLDSLNERQRRELSGVRDRLSILSESDTARWLDPGKDEDFIDLQDAVVKRAVVYFRLDSDRRMLLSQMLAAAIVSDLITLVANRQANPIPTVVVIDEFSAVAAEHVARLFGRARSAGISLILGTQELADLKGAGEGALREQVLANVATVIAHRQNVPESAELISGMAGTRPAWITTQQTEEKLALSGPSGRGSRRRGYEFEVHPTRIKQLRTGQAVVLTPGSGQRSTVARIHHPSEVHQ